MHDREISPYRLSPKHGASDCELQVYRTASALVTQGGIGVGSLLGPEATKCALLELYGSKHSKKRPAEEGMSAYWTLTLCPSVHKLKTCNKLAAEQHISEGTCPLTDCTGMLQSDSPVLLHGCVLGG